MLPPPLVPLGLWVPSCCCKYVWGRGAGFAAPVCLCQQQGLGTKCGCSPTGMCWMGLSIPQWGCWGAKPHIS